MNNGNEGRAASTLASATRVVPVHVATSVRTQLQMQEQHDFSLSMTHNSHSPARDSDETLYSTG